MKTNLIDRSAPDVSGSIVSSARLFAMLIDIPNKLSPTFQPTRFVQSGVNGYKMWLAEDVTADICMAFSVALRSQF